MADNPKLALDAAGLKNFIETQLAPFETALDAIANKDTDEGVTMDSILGKGTIPADQKEIFKRQHPLTVGPLADDGARTYGQEVVNKIRDVADSISNVYVQQINLFKDLHTNLDKTITKLFDGQHDSLDKIDGKAFLDRMGTLPGDFSGGGGPQS
jgi:hypothetical protein